MGAFDLRKNRETNRKFNKQVADLKKQEKNQQTKHQIKEVGKLAKGKGGSDSVEKFLNNKEPSQKGPKRLAMVNSHLFFIYFLFYFLFSFLFFIFYFIFFYFFFACQCILLQFKLYWMCSLQL